MGAQQPATVVMPDPAAVIDSFAVGYVALSRDWVIGQLNPAAEQILGRRAADLVGKDMWEQFPGARELEFGRVFEQVVATGQPAAFEAYYPGLDAWFELRVQPTADGGLAAYFVDVSARKTAERNAVEAARRADFLRDIGDALSSHLDVVTNVNRLAQLVVPYLGTWCIVSIADGDGRLVDTAWWHVDPARRGDVGQYAEVRQGAMPGTIAREAIDGSRPVALMRDAHALIRTRLSGVARERFDALAPVSSAVLPMIARGRTVGMLTLYSDDEGTEAQFEAAKDVAHRAALALDNSLAYERAGAARAEAEQARAEAEAATERLALLARVSESLAGTEDPDLAVANLARLVVPALADWCIVTVLDEDGEARDIGVAHRDPAREADAAAYAARRSANLAADSPLRAALRSGETWHTASLSGEYLQRVQTDGEAFELAMSLDPCGVAVIPLNARGRVFGALTFVTTTSRGAHTDDELAVAREVARRAGPVLDSARLAHRARKLAEFMQRSVLAVPPAPPGLDIVARYRPAQSDTEVGGDWYDHFDLPDGSTFAAIGDVMGHDTAAIAAMAQLRTLMRAAAWTARHSPAEVLADTDSASRALGPGAMATAITAILEPRADGGMTLRWSTAGHPPALVVDPDGSARFLEPDVIDVPIGVRSPMPRHDHVTALAPGALLLLYTDGLIERRGRAMDAGLGQLRTAVARLRELPLDDLLDTLVHELSPAAWRHDDIALLALRVAPVAAPPGTSDRLVVRLPDDRSAPAIARDRLAAYVGDLTDTGRQDAALITSELVTNALRHGASPITLDIRRIAHGVRVAVNDHGAAYPVLPSRPPDAAQTSGRGLLLTELLTTSWGIDSAPGGKTVWFTLVRPD